MVSYGLIAALIGIFASVVVFSRSKNTEWMLPIGLIILGILILIFIPSLFISVPWYIWVIGILFIIFLISRR